MNDLEDRVRRALHADVSGPRADQLLGDVHRGATRRRRRRVAGVVAASTLVLAAAAGTVTSVVVHERSTPDVPPASSAPSPHPTPTPTDTPLPAGATKGPVAVSVTSVGTVFRLTMNVGCTACSTVWQNDASGGWVRLHDFGAEASVGDADPGHGPLDHLVMAANGKDGWAWGRWLFSTHDGGRTWARVRIQPGWNAGGMNSVVVTGSSAWTLVAHGNGGVLYRTPVAADDWSTVQAPQLDRAYAVETVGDRVVLEVAGDGRAHPQLVWSTDDGSTWSTLDTPCAGEKAGSAAFLLCPASTASAGPTVYRTQDFTSWSVLGHAKAGITGIQALGDDRLLVVGRAGHATLMSPGGATPVDLPLAAAGDQTDESSWSGATAYVGVYGDGDPYLIRSSDGGHTWSVVP